MEQLLVLIQRRPGLLDTAIRHRRIQWCYVLQLLRRAIEMNAIPAITVIVKEAYVSIPSLVDIILSVPNNQINKTDLLDHDFDTYIPLLEDDRIPLLSQWQNYDTELNVARKLILSGYEYPSTMVSNIIDDISKVMYDNLGSEPSIAETTLEIILTKPELVLELLGQKPSSCPFIDRAKRAVDEDMKDCLTRLLDILYLS